MTRGSKKQTGAGAHDKGAGSGANTDLSKEQIGDNMVLSNRDKSQHTDQRGMDGKNIQNEQFQDHAANRLDDDAAGCATLRRHDLLIMVPAPYA